MVGDIKLEQEVTEEFLLDNPVGSLTLLDGESGATVDICLVATYPDMIKRIRDSSDSVVDLANRTDEALNVLLKAFFSKYVIFVDNSSDKIDSVKARIQHINGGCSEVDYHLEAQKIGMDTLSYMEDLADGQH